MLQEHCKIIPSQFQPLPLPDHELFSRKFQCGMYCMFCLFEGWISHQVGLCIYAALLTCFIRNHYLFLEHYSIKYIVYQLWISLRTNYWIIETNQLPEPLNVHWLKSLGWSVCGQFLVYSLGHSSCLLWLLIILQNNNHYHGLTPT